MRGETPQRPLPLGCKRPACRYLNPVITAPAAPTHTPAPIAVFDPGWLFLLAGLALLGATVLIPAADELSEVRLQRDRALVLEAHRVARISRYDDYLAALNREEPSLIMALAESQLNQIPQGRQPIIEQPQPLVGAPSGSASASVFAGLEPAPPTLPERVKTGSLLERWTTNDDTRPWLIAGGALCLLIGLLPKQR